MACWAFLIGVENQGFTMRCFIIDCYCEGFDRTMFEREANFIFAANGSEMFQRGTRPNCYKLSSKRTLIQVRYGIADPLDYPVATSHQNWHELRWGLNAIDLLCTEDEISTDSRARGIVFLWKKLVKREFTENAGRQIGTDGYTTRQKSHYQVEWRSLPNSGCSLFSSV